MKQQTGFTLIETVVFIVVVSVALAGIASVFSANIKNSAAPVLRERSIALAQAYMDEILTKQWDENTPLGSGCVDTDLANTTDSCTSYCAIFSTENSCNISKCHFDTATTSCNAAANVSAAFGTDATELNNRPLWDDIDDYSATPSQPKDSNGNNIVEYNGFTVAVAITQPASSWHGIAASDVRRIAVTVTNPLQESITLVSYRVNF